MANIKISNADLVWVFTKQLKLSGDCPPAISIAIVPTKDGWRVVASRRSLDARPRCAKCIERVQAELRAIYVLAKD